MKKRLTLRAWMNDISSVGRSLLINNNRWLVRHPARMRLMTVTWIIVWRSMIWIVVGSWRAVLLVGSVHRFRLINSRVLRRIHCDAAGWNLRLTRCCVCYVILVSCCRIVRWSFLNRQRWVAVRVNRWRLVRVIVGTSFIALCFVEHGGIFRWIAVGIWSAMWFGYFVGVRPDCGGHLRFRLRKDVIGEGHVLLERTWAGGVFHANDLIVVYIFRNGHHLVVDCTSLGNVSLGVCDGRRRNSASSRFSDIVLVAVVDWRRRDCTARLSI